MKLKILHVVGARPNFMKIAPLIRQMDMHPDEFDSFLLHTGQHYDQTMSKLFFDDLNLPRPDVYLGVGSASHGEQTGKIMIEFEKVLLRQKPDLVIVVGDVNSTIACGLVAVKQNVRFAHVEAGLRSFDLTMPEEINRMLTDRIADFLFTTEPSAEENLLREGIGPGKIHFVGNVMIDSLESHLEKAKTSRLLNKLGLGLQEYAAVTLHRPCNVDRREDLSMILDALEEIQNVFPVVFPVHPRTQKRLSDFQLEKRLKSMPNLVTTAPLSYLDFLALMASAKFVLTDSGGIQEETTVLGIPCLTIRESTERPITVTQGTNIMVGCNPERLVEESKIILSGVVKIGKRPDLWDGKAAERIVEVLRREILNFKSD